MSAKKDEAPFSKFFTKKYSSSNVLGPRNRCSSSGFEPDVMSSSMFSCLGAEVSVNMAINSVLEIWQFFKIVLLTVDILSDALQGIPGYKHLIKKL